MEFVHALLRTRAALAQCPALRRIQFHGRIFFARTAASPCIWLLSTLCFFSLLARFFLQLPSRLTDALQPVLRRGQRRRQRLVLLSFAVPLVFRMEYRGDDPPTKEYVDETLRMIERKPEVLS